ncbi:UNVERIFIED_CONTAM: hypothetical protein FKN15_075926 [Acipenser sinensis]
MSFIALQVYSEATRPIVPEDNTDLSGFYSRPASTLSATGVPVGHVSCLIVKDVQNLFARSCSSILKAYRVADDFHAHYRALSRTYVYRIITGARHYSQLPVFERSLCWAVHENHLNVTVLQEAAKLLLGTHDFSTFRSLNSETPFKSPIKTLLQAEVCSGAGSFSQHPFHRSRSLLQCIQITLPPAVYPDHAPSCSVSRSRSLLQCIQITLPPAVYPDHAPSCSVSRSRSLLQCIQITLPPAVYPDHAPSCSVSRSRSLLQCIQITLPPAVYPDHAPSCSVSRSRSLLQCIQITLPPAVYPDHAPSCSVSRSRSLLQCIQITLPPAVYPDHAPSCSVSRSRSLLQCIQITLPPAVYSDQTPSCSVSKA